MTTENITASYQASENFNVRKGLTPMPEPTITGMKLLGDVIVDGATHVINQVVVSGTTVTATTSDAHGFLPGRTVLVSHLDGNTAIANGTWTITSVTSTTFTFTVTSTSANGTYPGLSGAARTRLVLNTIDSSGNVWVATDIEGWWTGADSDFPQVDKAFGDGSYDASGRRLARQLALSGSILTKDPSYVPAARERLVEAVDLVYKGAWLKAVERQAGTATVAVSNVALTDGLATITTSAAHGYSVGETVEISNVTFSATTSGSTPAGTSMVLTSAAGILVGCGISGTSIPTGTTVTAISSNTLTLSAATTATIATSTSVTILLPHFAGTSVVTSVPDSTSFTCYISKNNYSSKAVTGTVRLGDIVKAAFVRLSGQPDIANVNARGRLDFNIGLSAADPVKYQWSDRFDGKEQAKFPSVGASATKTLVNTGNLNVGMELVVTGPTVGTLSIANSQTGETLNIIEPLNGSSTYTVIRKSLTGSLATLTTDVPNDIVVGQQIFVYGVDSDFNGSTISTTATGTSATNTVTLASATGVAVGYGIRGTNIPTGTIITALVLNVATLSANLTGALSATAVTIDIPVTVVYKPASNQISYTKSLAKTATVSSYALSAADPPVATITTSAAHGFLATEVVTVRNVDGSVNIDSVEIAIPTSTTFTYPTTRTKLVKRVEFKRVGSRCTIYTTEPHGYRVGDSFAITGCGRPFDAASETVVAVNNATNSISYDVTSRLITVTAMTVKKLSNTQALVTVTAAGHSFNTSDIVILAAKTAARAAPYLQGLHTIIKTGPNNFTYIKTTTTGTSPKYQTWFGVNMSTTPQTVPSLTAASANLADIAKNLTTRGTVTNTNAITTTAKGGNATISSISEQDASGSIVSIPDVLSIDTFQRSASINSGTNGRSKIEAITDWVTLAPGPNSLTIIDDGNSSSTAVVQIKYRSGWLS